VAAAAPALKRELSLSAKASHCRCDMVCCSVLQCVAVYCGVLQCVVVRVLLSTKVSCCTCLVCDIYEWVA